MTLNICAGKNKWCVPSAIAFDFDLAARQEFCTMGFFKRAGRCNWYPYYASFWQMCRQRMRGEGKEAEEDGRSVGRDPVCLAETGELVNVELQILR